MRRIIELDAVRGMAALAILVFHLDNRLLPQGWLAVDLFMLLSGYLITSIVLKNGRSKNFLLSFYWRRGVRIWPVYYLTLAAVFAVPVLFRQPVLASLPYYLTFTQNTPYYWSGTVPPFPWHFFHTWSLAVEEQYYLIWPAVLLLCRRKWLVPLSLSLVALCTWSRGAGAHWSLLVTRCDGFALGGILGVVLEDREFVARHRRSLERGFGLLAAVALGIAVFLWSEVVATAAPLALKSLWMLVVNVCFFGSLGLVIIRAGEPALRPLRNPVLCYFGRVSYGLYLFHPVVFVALDRVAVVIGLPLSPAFAVLKFAATVAAAALSWRYIERPLLGLKDRFRYQERPSSTPVSVPGAAADLGGISTPAAGTAPWVTSPA
jgi:peptidoglycan/LPS O-acetylase OafA/YrhL